ncbi:UNKNOWN [Stylonychia lemnae]|uniref:Uncharacterized protein n=1 Tax=Stylonychia lemnae TaxID=5949 RepID=A0A078AZP6_STYLE|nr:UNKNOWN [Stylonychia lemnae]|eukprot:CDW87880.1 UNKNOWN [Stylonychia lemnae]
MKMQFYNMMIEVYLINRKNMKNKQIVMMRAQTYQLDKTKLITYREFMDAIKGLKDSLYQSNEVALPFKIRGYKYSRYQTEPFYQKIDGVQSHSQNHVNHHRTADQRQIKNQLGNHFNFNIEDLEKIDISGIDKYFKDQENMKNDQLIRKFQSNASYKLKKVKESIQSDREQISQMRYEELTLFQTRKRNNNGIKLPEINNQAIKQEMLLEKIKQEFS